MTKQMGKKINKERKKDWTAVYKKKKKKKKDFKATNTYL